MRTVGTRIRNRDESIIYEALKECAPAYVAQGEAMTLHAMELCGFDEEAIKCVHEQFSRITTRSELIGQQLRCEDLVEHLKSKYNIDVEDIRVNFPDFKTFVKEWRE